MLKILNQREEITMFCLRKMLVVILAAAAVFSLCLPAVFASGEDAPDAGAFETVGRPAIISAGAVNIRELPLTTAKKMSEITAGKEIFVLDKTQDSEGNWWFRFNFTPADGSAMTGYVMAKYCNLVLDIGMVTAGAVNVRKTASTSGERAGGLTRGDGVYIFEIQTNSEGEWFRIQYNGSPAYIQAKYVGIMQLPAKDSVPAKYKNIVTAKAVFKNVPAGYQAVADGKTVISQGEESLAVSAELGQLADSRLVFIRLYDADGKLKGEKAVSIEVDNSFFGKIGAFFGFIFNGFKWNSQVAEIA